MEVAGGFRVAEHYVDTHPQFEQICRSEVHCKTANLTRFRFAEDTFGTFGAIRKRIGVGCQRPLML